MKFPGRKPRRSRRSAPAADAGTSVQDPETMPRRPRRFSGMYEVDPRRLVSISTPGKTVSVGVASTLILHANEQRIFASIVNDSANPVYIHLGGPAVSGNGIRLNANGGSLVFGLATDIPYLGAVYGIAVGASGVTVMEY